MLFANDDDDADFTVQPGSSKLASLFSDNETAKAGNSTLTYTPPKQPSVGKGFDKQSSSTGTLSLLHAAAVQAFKYEGKKPSNLGRLGIAVLGNHEKETYKLILYKEKQQQVTAAAINAHFIIRLLGNNFLTFVDEKRCNWSVKFDSEEAMVNFIKQAVIAKALSIGVDLTELNYCIYQDLVAGESEGDSLGSSSSAVVKYTAWILTSEHNLKKVFDTAESDEPQKIKIGRGKHVKGLEEGLLGCKKNSRKLLIVPPSHGYGLKGLGTTIPPNSVLVYDVSVISVSKPKSAAKDSTARSSTPVSLAAGDADKKEARSSSYGSTDEPAHSRAPSAPPDWPPQQPAIAPAPVATASGDESDKARLLSRIAKIGAQMLPMPGAVPAQPSSDSEVEEERPPSVHQAPTTAPLPQPAVREGSPKPVVKPRSFSQQSSGDTVSQPTPMQPALRPMVSAYTPVLPPPASTMPAAQHMALYQAQTQFAQGALAGYPYQQPGILLPPPHTYPAAAPMATSMSMALDAQLPLLLSETRSQNTDVRLNISKLADKVDCIIAKLDTLKSQPPPALPPLSSCTDPGEVLYNIQRIVHENIKLKDESSEKNNKIQALNEKICDLLQRNQRLMEESNTMFEQRSDTLHSSTAHSQARVLALEAEKVEVSERLSQTLSELSLLKAELSERQQKEHQAQKELGELQSALGGSKSMLKSLEDSLKEAKQQKQDLEMQIEGYKDASPANAAHSSEQIAQLEESISAHWKSVCDTEAKKLNARISALEAENEALLARMTELDSKCEELATSGEKQRQVYEDKMLQLQQENRALSTGTASAPASFDFEMELKKIMNTLFKLLQREFSHEETYSSKEAKGIILNSIRDYTTAVLERRHASSAFGDGTSRRTSPMSTSSGRSTASPAAAEVAASQQSSCGAGKQDGKHEDKQESPETLPAAEILSPSPFSGPSGPSQHDECTESAPEDAEASSNEVVQTGEDGKPVLPQEAQDVVQTGDEKEAADNAKEGASGDAETSSPSSESKTEAEPLAESRSIQPPDWSWKPQPPPAPLFDQYEDDDWLN